MDPVQQDLLTIWRAAIAAVASDLLVERAVQVTPNGLDFGTWRWTSRSDSRVVVVGAGKAGAGMAAGLLRQLGPENIRRWRVTGWINVPADCVRPMETIHLHAARPAGVNEPTQEGVDGARQIMKLVRSLSADDLCIVLLSGGGSALLPLPIGGVSLADKLQVTRQLSAAGATIQQLNCVRRELSQIKGGGLARACGAGALMTLVISDVIGDDLRTIASGPTVSIPRDPEAALRVWSDLRLPDDQMPPSVRRALNAEGERVEPPDVTSEVIHQIVGHNGTAVAAALREAERLGYVVHHLSPEPAQTTADTVGLRCSELLQEMGERPGRRCVVWGGEPVVRLAPAGQRGRGGRNQQLVLAAAVDRLAGPMTSSSAQGLLSGGTDGEDGPTDAAGATLTPTTFDYVRRHADAARAALLTNNAYQFWSAAGGLLKTGPTHTNVCDVRILIQQ